MLSVYSVTNTNTPTHSEPVDRIRGLHGTASSKCLQNMGSFYFFTTVLGVKHKTHGVDYENIYTETIAPETGETYKLLNVI